MQRFLSLDPLAADFASWSAYNYVLGNPISLVDPDGRAPVNGGNPILSGPIALAKGVKNIGIGIGYGVMNFVGGVTSMFQAHPAANARRLGNEAGAQELEREARNGLATVIFDAAGGKGATKLISGLKGFTKIATAIDDVGAQVLDPSGIRFSQSSVNGADGLVKSMKQNGWKGDPIDVVKMKDGGLTTIDNTRVLAANEAGVNVQATVRNFDDALPANMVERFTTKKGVPSTWGEAVTLRIQKQKATYRNNNPNGSFNIEGKLKE